MHSGNGNGDTADVVVIGGAFSGASCALLLRRWLPDRRVVVVERAEEFDRKVGEATVEVSSLFLHRVLGQTDYLAHEQLPKHGLRYWFSDRPDRSLAEMSEVGPAEVPRLPSFLLDRAALDEHLLAEAGRAGAEVIRPAKVGSVELGWPESRVEVEAADGSRQQLTTRWVVDASGRHAFLARRLRIHHRTEEHPTAALWGRWTGVADLDGPEVLGSDPRSPALPPVSPARRLATNHFCGYGWWCWFIPLAGGETSVGVVWNKELVELPGDTPLERYRRFLEAAPGVRELLAGARLDEEDFRGYSHLPYRTERYADRGWALVGDAAAFMDPYYSPGLDHAAMTAYSTARLIEDDLSGTFGAEGGDGSDGTLEAAVEQHNRVFVSSYDLWLSALYVGKYEILGDAELAGAAYLMDTALYYVGIVKPKVDDLEDFRHPPFGKGLWQERVVHRLMHGYARRLIHLARRRRALGIYGRRNSGWRALGNTPGLGPRAFPMLWSGLRLYLRAELETFWAGLRPGAGAAEAPTPGRGAKRRSRARDGARPAPEAPEEIRS
jgi:flavin-dependent dehydrogenase